MQSKETSQRFLQLTVLLCKLFDPVKTYNANISVPKVYVNMGEVDYSVIKKINLFFIWTLQTSSTSIMKKC